VASAKTAELANPNVELEQSTRQLIVN
jgi:hypothetical protein